MTDSPLTSEQIKDAERLRSLFAKRKADFKRQGEKLTQESVASECGWTQGALGHYLHGRTPLNLEASIKIADALGVSVSDFSPSLGLSLSNIATNKGERGVRRSNTRFVPVRGSAQMGDKGYWVPVDYLGDGGDGYLEVNNVSTQAYVIRAVGESMFPAIRSGWYLVFEPTKEPMPGEYVHVILNDGRNMIKEFVSCTNGILTLISVNGMERLSFDEKDVKLINPFVEIQPPSRLIPEIPVMESADIDCE